MSAEQTPPGAPPDPPPPDPSTGARRRPPLAGSFGRSVFGAFARGVGLVALALAVGVVLLQWSDASTDTAAGGQPPPTGTPAAPPPEPTTTTSTAPAGPRAAGDVAVLVLNGTGKPNQAKPMSDRLGSLGYKTLTPGNAALAAGSAVLCRPGLEPEGAALAGATGLSPRTGALDEVAARGFEGSSGADCVVVLGSG